MKTLPKGIIFLLVFLPLSLAANNIQVSNVGLSGHKPGAQFTLIDFDLSWENSWRLSGAPANWDAAWVFVKFRANYGPWQHATLNYVNGKAVADGHTEAIGSTLTTTSDGLGAFIYRAGNGVGDVDWKKFQLRWNYGVDGVANNALIEVKVFAVEMVYVPEGKFELGGGNQSEIGKLYAWSAFLTSPYTVSSEAEIPVGISAGSLYYFSPTDEHAGDQNGPIPATFPKGYDAFYCMKYEVSQRQWVDFFNLLTPSQQANNDLTDLDHKGPNTIDRNSISWDGSGGASTDHPDVPVSFTQWSDILAYMDWAGLRPMSELEYIKACRGSLPAVAGGYAWGTNEMIDLYQPITLVNKDSNHEQVLNPVSDVGNARVLSFEYFTDGAFRCGIYAASASTEDREETGASYYGIMEMSGNVWEMAVTIGTPGGRKFRANHGDGLLDADGEADVVFWPPGNGNGGGLFGGSWFSAEGTPRISDRRNATLGNTGYFTDVGFRAVRSAP